MSQARIGRAKRLEAVRKAIEAGEWTPEVTKRLAAETGYCRRTILRDRDMVLKGTAAEPTENRPQVSQMKRLEMVEQAIREEGWSPAVVRRLVEETGYCRRTIWRDRDDVLDLLAEEEQADLPRRRAGFLADIRRIRRKAVTAGEFPSAARLLDMESKVLGLDRAPLPEVDDDDDEELDTSLEAVLREVRRMRKQAQAGHSYVAADKLLAREHELVEAIQRRDQAQADAERAARGDGDVVATVAERLNRLPESMRLEIIAALQAG